MEPVALSDSEVVPLESIAPDVTGLRVVFVNVYTIRGAGGQWSLVDSGLPLSTTRVKHWVQSVFGENAKPQNIILTHGHFDHVGTVQELANEWNVPVFAHPAELPFLNGQTKYPPPDPSVGGGLMAVMSPLFPRTSTDIRDRVQTLPSDGSVPGLPGWRWLHTPGHAPGHVSLFRESDRLLLPGDAFCTTNQSSFLAVASQKPELTGPPAYYTPDWDAARDSVRKLAVLRPLTVAPGHGLPMSGDQVAGQLDDLARNFDQIARPEHGVYARPAVDL